MIDKANDQVDSYHVLPSAGATRQKEHSAGMAQKCSSVTVKLSETRKMCVTTIDYGRLCTDAEQRFMQAILRIRGAQRSQHTV